MKKGKRVLSFLLSAIMVLGTCAGLVDLTSLFSIEASAADITLGGITQKRVVSNYASLYASYQERFFTGKNSNSPTNFVIPGLSQGEDYTPQGMTYWEEKEWILISAYDASGSGKHSVIYALDAKTTNFVALFKILNANGSVNTSHGGGIAASKYNFYYADTASKISYIPLSEFDVAEGTVKEVKLRGSINCAGELGGAATSYCCYEDGVLWAGNFYYSGDDSYKTSAHSSSDSMIVGYELHGNSSAEEWHYLSTGYNLVKLNNPATNQTSGAMTYTPSYSGGKIMISGKITTDSAIGEITPSFASLTLTEGKKYKVEFTASNNLSDMYFFAPTGNHCNVKQSAQTTITKLDNGYYRYSMVFTAGLRPTGADSTWPTTQSTNGSYTGTYTMRFDQDSIPAGGREFVIKDFAVMEYVDDGIESNPVFEGRGCAGNPTHVITFPGMDKFQYAMVYKGRVYISRSWKRTSGDNHTRELMVGDLDISSPGDTKLNINGKDRFCHVLKLDMMTRFGGDNGNSVTQNQPYNDPNKMLYMGEALCVMNDHLYMFGEGAAWNYNGKDSSNKCPEPIDVIWKIDQHAIMGEDRPKEDVALSHYEKVWSMDEIDAEGEYLIVYESELQDPVTQKNIIYALDAFGGYGVNKLPKQDAGTQANTGDSLGIIGYSITEYSKSDDGNTLYITDEDDANRSIRWQIKGANTSSLRINNTDLFYNKYNHLYFGSRLFAMTTDARSNLDKIKITTSGAGNFNFYYEGDANYYLWCNDGSNQAYMDAYTNYYSAHGKSGYTPVYHGLEEKPGTFHSDGLYSKEDANSGNIMHYAVDSKYKNFQIYKRVADQYADTYDTRVYTDLKAELQADGTYKIDVETYAIGETQYQKVAERPTDFILVLDASSSMTNNTDARGYHTELNNWSALKMKQACGDVGDKFFTRGDNYNTACSGNFYYKLPDGEFAKIYVAFNEKGSSSKYERDIWLWCQHPVTGRCYKLSKNGYLLINTPVGDCDVETSSDRLTEAMFLANPNGYGYASGNDIVNEAKSDKNRTDYHGKRDSTSERANYEVLRYTYKDGYGDTRATYYTKGECFRLEGMQQAVEKLTYKIEQEAKNTGLNHRIAVVQFGSTSDESYLNTGLYTNSSVSMINYNGGSGITAANYRSVFYDTSNFAQVRRIVNNITTTNGDADTFVNHGMDMARNIVAHETAGRYLADGDRSACIVMITDGVPGKGSNDASSATSTANAAINEAYQAKLSGAYVYSVQMGNNNISGFSMDTYMENISSKYIYAKSMTDSGDENVRDVKYTISVPTDSTFNITNLVNDMFNSIQSNSTNALAKLDAESVLRAEITEAFDLSNATVKAQLADANYDGLDRLYFADPKISTDISVSYNKSENTVSVTNYDYSYNYVSVSNAAAKRAKKLVVTFEGVVPNVDAELDDANINDTTTTAIYQDKTKLSENKEFKLFPTEHFTIPEYTYVLDFDLPMLDTDVNGTLVAVDTEPRKQNVNNYTKLLYNDDSDIIVGFANNNQDLVYSLRDGASNDTERSRAYVLIQRPDETYDWFKLNIVPASNVLYGDYDKFKETGNASYPDAESWVIEGAKSDKYQSLTGDDDLYGYDNAYNVAGNIFSAGNAYSASVSDSNPRTTTLSFDYTGTAVDVISACGPETGIQIVTIRNNLTGKVEKVYIIDTYYTDSTYLNSNDLMCQVPVIHHENTNGYGTYSVEITGVYLASMVNARPMTMSLYSDDTVNFYTPDTSWMIAEAVLENAGMEDLLSEDIEVLFADENSVFNGGTGAGGSAVSTYGLTRAVSDRPLTELTNYFDGFRVYNPLGDMSGDYVESEQGSSYYNIINGLASADDIITGSASSLMAYVEGGSFETIEFADYAKSNAPMNEVYLSNSLSGVTFSLETSAESKVMVSLRAVNGATKAKINNQEITVTSATEMYYDITKYIDVASGNPVVTIQNSGSGLLAVCNLKVVSGGIAPMMMSALPRVRMMMAAPVEEEVPEEPSVLPEVTPNPGGTGNDPDLDVEGDIPVYVPETNEPETETESATSGIINTIEAVFNSIKAFFEKIMAFFNSLFA